eukprot:GILI01004295.1.p1 GENE.GILI01004295.1~~GILI01004295.1.p1  ORF type:complete len:288 (+),score=58.55 GILI01004295.1:43-864(+)
MSSDAYFRRLQNRVAGGSTGATTTTTQHSTLLTQAAQVSGPTTGGNRNVAVTDDEIREQVRRIRQDPTNTSPNDASALRSLLPPPMPTNKNKKCLVLDVDETLVHSSYQPPGRYDLHLKLRVQGNICNVYVAYRPFVREFFKFIAPLFEIVIFTASVSIYCEPLMDALDDTGSLGRLRLFREHCSYVQGSHVKDLNLLGRDLNDVVIIDNSPIAYLFQQRNAIPILSWFSDERDDELMKLLPVLAEIAKADSVYDVLDPYNARLQLEKQKAER